MKTLLHILKFFGQTLFILFFCCFVLWILGMYFIELSGITPPGAAGISIPFELMILIFAVLFFLFAWWFKSPVPCISSAFWVAFYSGQVAFMDSRVGLGKFGFEDSFWLIYGPIFATAAVILPILLTATYAGRFCRLKLSCESASTF